MYSLAINLVRFSIIVTLLSGCSSSAKLNKQNYDNASQKGNLISIEPIDDYSLLTLRFMFWMEGLNETIPISNGIDLYRIIYWTEDSRNELVQASGLIAMPKSTKPLKGIVSWQHGTASLRSDAPSNLSVAHGLLPAAVFSGHGYILLAPDYIGFGVSQINHSYYHLQSTADSVNDLITASKQVLQDNNIALPESTFLTGFSQGGYASLAATKNNEQNKLHNIVAVAPIAAAVNLVEGISDVLNSQSRFGSLYIAWIARTYAKDYGLDLRTTIKEPWRYQLENLFDGTHNGEEITNALPNNPGEMLTNNILLAIENQTSHPFLDLLRENELVDWTPTTPICVFSGEADIDVSPKQADILLSMNPELVTSVSVGNLTHDDSVVAAAPMIRAWFDGNDYSGCPDLVKKVE